MKAPNAIFFDWDGTLVDTIEGIIAYNNMTRAHYGMPPINAQILKEIMAQSAREYYRDTFGEKADEALAIHRNFVHEHHLNYIKEFLGVWDLFEFLKSKKIYTGVVSNKQTNTLQKEIHFLGWGNLFDVVVGAGEAMRDKPSPDPLLLAAQKLALNPETSELWYVGDTVTDMKAANSAGFKAIYIEHGFDEPHEIEAYDPLFTVKDLIALKAKLA